MMHKFKHERIESSSELSDLYGDDSENEMSLSERNSFDDIDFGSTILTPKKSLYNNMLTDSSFDEYSESESIVEINSKSKKVIPTKNVIKSEIINSTSENMPRVMFRVGGQCYPISSIKCHMCRSNILPPVCFIIGNTEKSQILYCEKCALELEKTTEICKVCRQPLTVGQKVIPLLADFKVHESCLHCTQCSRTKNDNLEFSVFSANKKDVCLCKDCMQIANGQTLPKDTETYCGRFNSTVFRKMGDKACPKCGSLFEGRFFVVHSGILMCRSCGKKFIE